MDVQTTYQKAIKFAALKHVLQEQLVPGTELPYVVHLSNVAMEIFMAAANTASFDLDFAIQLALLHDTIEDTETTVAELASNFGEDVAAGVLALTKNKDIRKDQRMIDSLSRIVQQPKEVWAVKLADRITNLQSPPEHWSHSKKMEYQKQASTILEMLKGGNAYLEKRLMEKINVYSKYLTHG